MKVVTNQTDDLFTRKLIIQHDYSYELSYNKTLLIKSWLKLR